MLQYFQIPGQMQHIGRTFYRRMTPIAAGLLLTCLAAGTGCTPGGNPSPDTTSTPAMVGLLEGYALSSPDHIAHLPKKLREASDVTAVSQNQVAMVQDEKGIIFLFDLRTDKVVRKIKFGPKGDYEGLALLSENMYVLESSGILFKVKDWQSSASAVASRLHLPAKDNESLCYDSIGKQLLISPKSRWQKKKGGHKSKHPVFAVDPATDTMIPRPTFTIDPRDVVAFAMAHGLSLSGASEGKPHKKERLQLMLSAIAVHPLTGDIYAVSAHNRLLLSFDRTGRVTGLVQLNPALFMQPEGLAFLPDGTLIIVNESPRKKPGLLLFGWHRPKQ